MKTCKTCDTNISHKHFNSKYCDPCAKDARRRTSAESSRRNYDPVKYKESGYAKIKYQRAKLKAFKQILGKE